LLEIGGVVGMLPWFIYGSYVEVHVPWSQFHSVHGMCFHRTQVRAKFPTGSALSFPHSTSPVAGALGGWAELLRPVFQAAGDVKLTKSGEIMAGSWGHWCVFQVACGKF
jgi:hypothetical protein